MTVLQWFKEIFTHPELPPGWRPCDVPISLGQFARLSKRLALAEQAPLTHWPSIAIAGDINDWLEARTTTKVSLETWLAGRADHPRCHYCGDVRMLTDTTAWPEPDVCYLCGGDLFTPSFRRTLDF